MILEVVLSLVLLCFAGQNIWLTMMVKRLERRQDRMLTKMGWRITDI